MNKKTLMALCGFSLMTLSTISACQAAPEYDNMDSLVAASNRPATARSLSNPNRAYTSNGPSDDNMSNNNDFSQRGLASWYASNLEGRLTTSGEPYNPNELTAAHPSLPMFSYVRVTHLGSGRSVIVRINDHATLSEGRVINLSRAAAEELNIVNAGMAQVEIQAIPRPNNNDQENDNRMAREVDDEIGQVAMRFSGR